MTAEAAYRDLQFYTLAHGGPEFVHQHVVDTWTAQHANAETKPIGLTFALVGLFLHLERGFSGREVQRAHMRLARRKERWPTFALPAERGRHREITVLDVMAAPAGPERDRAIEAWCAAVWTAYASERLRVVAWLKERGIG